MVKSIFRWIIVNTFGWGLGLTLGVYVMHSKLFWNLVPPNIAIYLSLAAGGAVSGFLLGLFQWLGIRKIKVSFFKWILFSIVGGVLAYVITSTTYPILQSVDFGMGFKLPSLSTELYFSLGYKLGGPSTGFVVGLMLGITQYFGLKGIIWIWRWILINTLAATLSFLLGNIMSEFIPSLFLIACLTGLLFGVISGVLLPHSKTDK